MNNCKYYRDCIHISPTETKICCKLMPDGGRVYENSSKEGRDAFLRCFHNGECDIRAAYEAGEPTEQLSLTEETSAAADGIPAELEARAARLHRQIMANGQIAAESIVAMAIDLRTMRDEKPYTYLGCEDFNDYCEQKVGIKQRHAYNFIKVLDKYGEKQLAEYSHLGIAKLVELTALDERDRQELLSDGEAEKMSVRELKDRIKELESRCEQLTLDLGEEQKESSEAAETADSLIKQLEELRAKYDKLLTAEDEYKDEISELRTKNAELEARPIDVAVQKPSEEELEKLREEAREEERERALQEHKVQEERHKEELKKAREKADDERVTAVAAARKQEADKLTAEIDRLKRENAALQSNAKPAVPPNNAGAQIKFYMEECRRSFNAAAEVIRSVEDEEKRGKYIAAMKEAVQRMGGELQ